jgi:uncharacterized protein
MPFEIFETLFRKMEAYSSNLSIVWHGGEPLMRGIEFFEKAYALINQSNAKTNASMQTNGTLITPKMADFLIENNISFGISLDGPREIHNSNRYFCNGRGSFDSIMAGIEVLKSKGYKRPSAIAVFTKKKPWTS